MENFQLKNKLIFMSLILFCGSIMQAMTEEEMQQKLAQAVAREKKQRATQEARKAKNFAIQQKTAPVQKQAPIAPTSAPTQKKSWFGFGSSAAPKAQEAPNPAPTGKTPAQKNEQVKVPAAAQTPNAQEPVLPASVQPKTLTAEQLKEIRLSMPATLGSGVTMQPKTSPGSAKHVRFSPAVQEQEIPARTATVGTAVVQPTAQLEAQITKTLEAAVQVEKAEQTLEQAVVAEEKATEDLQAALDASAPDPEDGVTLVDLLAALQSKVIELSNIVAPDLVGRIDRNYLNSSIGLSKIKPMTPAQMGRAYQVAQQQKAAVTQTTPVVQPTVAAPVATPTIEIKAPVAKTSQTDAVSTTSGNTERGIVSDVSRENILKLQDLQKQVDAAVAEEEQAIQKKLTWGQYLNPFADKPFPVDPADSIVDEDKNSNLERAWKPEDGPSRLDQAWDWVKGKYSSFRTPSENQINPAVDQDASTEKKPGMMTRASNWTKRKLGGSLGTSLDGFNQGVSGAVRNEQARGVQAQNDLVGTGNEFLDAELMAMQDEDSNFNLSTPTIQSKTASFNTVFPLDPVAQPVATQPVQLTTPSQPLSFGDRVRRTVTGKVPSPRSEAQIAADNAFMGMFDQELADDAQMKADNALIKEANREIFKDSLSDRASQVVDNFSDGLNIAPTIPLHRNTQYLKEGRDAAARERALEAQYAQEEAQQEEYRKEGEAAEMRERELMIQDDIDAVRAREQEEQRVKDAARQEKLNGIKQELQFAQEGREAADRERKIEAEEAKQSQGWLDWINSKLGYKPSTTTDSTERDSFSEEKSFPDGPLLDPNDSAGYEWDKYLEN